MARIVVPLVLLLAVGAFLYFVVAGGGAGGSNAGDLDRAEFEAWTPPELRGTGRPGARGATADRTTDDETRPTRAEDEEARQALVVRGRVVADESGEGLADAALVCKPHREPCPGALQDWQQGPPDPWGTERSKKDGTFEAWIQTDRNLAAPRVEKVDVFASLAGRVPVVVCNVAAGQEIEIRLPKGLEIQGRILDARGRPVAKAAVRAVPGPETPRTLGHATVFERPLSDEEGRFTLAGLLPGEVMIQVDHPHFMPLESGPYDPKDKPDVTLHLEPALRAILVLHTDDGRVPEHPALVWESDPPQTEPQALLLRAKNAEEQLQLGKGIRCEPVRLPSSAKALRLRVKADEYAMASIPAFRPPANGGEETFEVTLTGDLGTGSIRIEFEDDQAQPLSAVQADVTTRLIALDPDAKPGGAFVVEPGLDLRITSLPTGSYRVLLFSKAFAPLETDVAVTSGQEAVRKLRANPPAKVRVRFFADQATLVRFRLMQEGHEAVVFPETGTQTTDEKTGLPVLAAGQDGLVLSGLAAGTYTIVVVSEELTAPETIVHLSEGDTTDVEIRVSRR